MSSTNIKRVSLDLDLSLREQMDVLSLNSKHIRNCTCGGSAWQHEDEVDGATGVGYYVCAACNKRRHVLRTKKVMRSSADGSSYIDGVIRQYFASPRKLPPHQIATPARVGLYLPRPLHRKARDVAYQQGITLGALLARVIAADFAPKQERAA